MLRFIIKRLIIMMIMLALVSLVVFSVLFVLPGDPAQIMLGINATPETLQALRHELGLDRPFWIQYGDWIGTLLTGGSSRSLNYDVPVYEIILGATAITGPLAMLAVFFSIIISIPLGIFAARHHNKPQDVTIMAVTQIGLATPEFWLGILLMLLFAVRLNWFHAGGFPGWSANFWGSLQALLLPGFALGIIRASILARLTRSSMLEVLGEDYVRTARAKGLRERTVVYVHALRNALIPVITILGLQMGQLLAGAIIIENVYYLPGLGRAVFQAINQRDLPVVREVVLFMAAAVVLINFIVDLTYAYLDPRIRMD